MALALGGGAHERLHSAFRIDPEHRGVEGRNVDHPPLAIDRPVHAGRFDDEGQSDPEPVPGARALPAFEAPLLVPPSGIGRTIEGALEERRVVAAVVHRPAGALVRQLLRTKEVPSPDLHRVETRRAGDPAHEPFDHERPEGKPHPAVRPGGKRLVATATPA